MVVRVITMCKFKEVYERFNNLVIVLDKLSDAPASIAPPVPAALPLMASALVAFGISRRSKVKA